MFEHAGDEIPSIFASSLNGTGSSGFSAILSIIL
jgi:hypothetical protein